MIASMVRCRGVSIGIVGLAVIKSMQVMRHVVWSRAMVRRLALVFGGPWTIIPPTCWDCELITRQRREPAEYANEDQLAPPVSILPGSDITHLPDRKPQVTTGDRVFGTHMLGVAAGGVRCGERL